MLRRVEIFLLVLCLVACAGHSASQREAAERQITSTFFTKLVAPARFIVQLQTPGATYLRNGKRVPLRLHESLKFALEQNDLLYKEGEGFTGKKYALSVEKQEIKRQNADFSESLSKAMERLDFAEAPYMIEVSVEEIVKNAKGEELFGKRVALFSVTLHRSEDDIAADIVRSIDENLNEY